MPGSASPWAVILAGGAGERFWPLSRADNPKQLQLLVGNETILQTTVALISPIVAMNRIIVVANARYRALVHEQIPGLPAENLLGEPDARGTAAAVAWAAQTIITRDPEAVMVVFPADHHILNPSALHDAVRVASETAETSRSLVFFGLAPHSADTRHGYILHGPNPLGLSDPTVYEIERFHEKPLVGTAERYIRQGNCLWNAGTFAWRADTILRELAMYAPNVLKAVRSAMRVADDTVAFGSAYSKVPKVSVDSALLEHSDKRLVVASNIKRIDFESWASLAQVWPQDANGNACAGDIVSVNCNNTVQFSSGKLLATAGLEDCIVIATEDVLLVCHKDRAADVDQLLRLLEARDKH